MFLICGSHYINLTHSTEKLLGYYKLLVIKYPHQRIIYCGRKAIHMCNINKRNKLKEKWKRCQRQMICPRSKLVSTKARNITMSTEKKKKPQSHLTEFLLCHIKLPAEVIFLFVFQTGFNILNQATTIVEREIEENQEIRVLVLTLLPVVSFFSGVAFFSHSSQGFSNHFLYLASHLSPVSSTLNCSGINF